MNKNKIDPPQKEDPIKKELLKDKIGKYFAFCYNDDVSNNIASKNFDKDFNEFILDRISLLYNKSNYVIIEEKYIEAEWKLMYSKHYIHSAYASDLKESVIRIHFLLNKEFNQDNYLGFVTLRPIGELSISLSFIYPNWKQNILDNPDTNVMTYTHKVHYRGKTIEIETYPFFAQDSIVTCCADVNIIMLSKYLSRKYNLCKMSFEKIINNNKHKHKLPRTVTKFDIENALNNLEINFIHHNYKYFYNYK